VSEAKCVWDVKAELGEGVFWHAREQAVYWVDIIESNLHRLSADGEQQSWNFPGKISAVMPCSDGGLLASFENGLSRIDLKTEQVTPLLALETDQPDNRFNDGCTDTHGQFWFGSMDDKQQSSSGSFYRLDRTGEVHQLKHFGEICITNGPAFSADGRWVYFTDTLEKKVFRAELHSQSEPGQPELFIDFSTLKGHPDGMCSDWEGNLWVCHFGGSRVTCFDTDGREQSVIELPVPNITKCAFGGPDLNTLYITTARAGLDQAQREQYPLSGGLFSVDAAGKGVITPDTAFGNRS
jgi:xylono-1,5-lactonase